MTHTHTHTHTHIHTHAREEPHAHSTRERKRGKEREKERKRERERKREGDRTCWLSSHTHMCVKECEFVRETERGMLRLTCLAFIGHTIKNSHTVSLTYKH